MNYSISGAILLFIGLINITFLNLGEFAYKKIVLVEHSELTSYNKLAFDDFTILYIVMLLLIIFGISMIIYDIYLQFKNPKLKK